MRVSDAVADQSPIGSYGLLGDTRTAALVSEQGSVDWLCVPRFDGDAVFGRLIDPDHGGTWVIRPVGSRVLERAYAANSTSLETKWTAPAGDIVVREGMIADATSQLIPRSTLVRRVTCLHGEGEVELVFDPRLGLPGRVPSRVSYHGDTLVCCWGSTAVGLTTDRAIRVRPGTPCSFTITAGESITFAMGVAFREPLVFVPPNQAGDLLEGTDRWWRGWVERFEYQGPHRDDVIRSLITLRLLTYAPSGAPVAAPTTSLPAPVGGDQNWDYRFAWPRDASIGVRAFLDFGGIDEPRAFLEWLVNAGRITRPRLEVLYDLDGRPVRYEKELKDVAGYLGSAPVRVGNAAAFQHQLDVYGWVLDAGWCMHDDGASLSGDQWRAMRAFADLLADKWREPDNGIWEEREPPRHYVHSKLMAWLGLDRAVRLSRHYPSHGRALRWQQERDLCASEIRSRGLDPSRRTYVRAYGSTDLDASILGGPLLEFEPPDSPYLTGTIDAVRRELGADGALLYRYRKSNVGEGAFLPCSFWLVQSLARAGRYDDAEEALDQLCRAATSLGLFSEQLDVTTGEPIGNFPQAFTHATFLQAIAALTEARGKHRGSTRTKRARSA